MHLGLILLPFDEGGEGCCSCEHIWKHYSLSLVIVEILWVKSKACNSLSLPTCSY